MEAFDVWEEVCPYLHLIVEADEMRLALAMGDRRLSTWQVADLLGVPHARAAEMLHRAYARCTVDKVLEDGVSKYQSADFYARLDHFVKYGAWHDIPEVDRKAINRRYLDEFIRRHEKAVRQVMSGLVPETHPPNDTVMLLEEVEEMIHAASEIIVQPCDCRMLGENCDRPVETCIWLDEGARQALDRGFGRRLTKAEAVQLLRQADAKGLMHTSDAGWREHGLSAICNCCACDCYPFLAAQELGSKGVWPKSNYVASYDPGNCDQCGACVKRCHFEAFYHDGSMVEVDGKNRPGVALDVEKCWGCGLCANTCPRGAIVMVPIA